MYTKSLEGYAVYADTTANFTGTLQEAGSNVVTASDIGTTVQGYSANLTAFAAETAPTGTVVGTTDTQTLTNKTVTTVAHYETKVAIAASNIDLSLGNYFTKTISGATTFTLTNVPATGLVASFILDLTDAGSAVVTWFAGTKWAGGIAPTLTTAGRDVLGFFTHDGGTSWVSFVMGKDMK